MEIFKKYISPTFNLLYFIYDSDKQTTLDDFNYRMSIIAYDDYRLPKILNDIDPDFNKIIEDSNFNNDELSKLNIYVENKKSEKFRENSLKIFGNSVTAEHLSKISMYLDTMEQDDCSKLIDIIAGEEGIIDEISDGIVDKLKEYITDNPQNNDSIKSEMTGLNDNILEKNIKLSVYKFNNNNEYIIGINGNNILKITDNKSKKVGFLVNSVGDPVARVDVVEPISSDKLTSYNYRNRIINNFIKNVTLQENYDKIKNKMGLRRIYQGINNYLLNQLIFLCKTIRKFKDIIKIYKGDPKLKENIKKLSEILNIQNSSKVEERLKEEGGVFQKILNKYYESKTSVTYSQTMANKTNTDILKEVSEYLQEFLQLKRELETMEVTSKPSGEGQIGTKEELIQSITTALKDGNITAALNVAEGELSDESKKLIREIGRHIPEIHMERTGDSPPGDSPPGGSSSITPAVLKAATTMTDIAATSLRPGNILGQ